MKNIYVYGAILSFSLLSGHAIAKPSRTLTLGDSDIGLIHTAIGYSTILQFDSRPMSVVVGDQDSFKVEYVGNSLTIKPVIPGGRTNMFVFTGYDRFSFKVATGRSDGADYFVEIKRKSSHQDLNSLGIEVAGVSSTQFSMDGPSASKMSVQTIGRKIDCSGLEMRLDSIASPKAKPWLVIALSLSNNTGNDEPIEFQGQDIFLTRGQRLVPFDTLYLESLKLEGSGKPVHGTILLKLPPQALAGITLNFRPAILAQSRCRAMKLTLKPHKKTAEKKEVKPNENGTR